MMIDRGRRFTNGGRPITFWESVVLRPAMYTPRGSYGEAITFMVAYAQGKTDSLRNAERGTSISFNRNRIDEFSEFTTQLAQRFQVSDALDAFREFRREFSSDDDAFDELMEEMGRFFDSRPSSS